MRNDNNKYFSNSQMVDGADLATRQTSCSNCPNGNRPSTIRCFFWLATRTEGVRMMWLCQNWCNTWMNVAGAMFLSRSVLVSMISFIFLFLFSIFSDHSRTRPFNRAPVRANVHRKQRWRQIKCQLIISKLIALLINHLITFLIKDIFQAATEKVLAETTPGLLLVNNFISNWGGDRKSHEETSVLAWETLVNHFKENLMYVPKMWSITVIIDFFCAVITCVCHCVTVYSINCKFYLHSNFSPLKNLYCLYLWTVEINFVA